MSSSFTVNKHDLEYILKQIKVSELQSTGMTTVAAIQAIYGVSAADAALLPAGLRTVDGRDNNLLPGQQDFGAADTLFPRLLEPVYNDENDELPFVGITNTNYDPNIDVVDSDPRTISNLIVDQTAANPAAILAALAALGITGVEATNAQQAITSAYEATLRANGFNAAVAAAQSDLNAANMAQAAAVAANNAVVAKHNAYVAGEPLADAAATSAAAVPALLSILADAIDALAAPEAALAAAEALLAPLEASVQAAQDNLTAAQAALAAADPTNLPVFLVAVQAVADATAALAAADTAAQPQRDADGVLVALNPPGPLYDFTTPAAELAAAEAEALVAALDLLDENGIHANDAAALAAATTDFNAFAAAASSGAFPSLVADAFDALAGPAAALAAANAAQTQAQSFFNIVSAAADTAGTPEETAAALAETLDGYGVEVGADGALFIQNLSPDIGLSPSFNTYMTIFGQFFDHGLDLVTKGGNGTVYIPLQADDPLIAGADGVFGTADDLPQQLRFMALTRATQTVVDGVVQHENTTTPFVDQNQTYTSHASHQVFLREYVRMDAGDGMKTYSTGHLLDGKTANGSLNGAIGNWAEVKANALEFLGINLDDFDVHSAPLLATDAYGNMILGPNGYAQLVMEPDAAHPDSNWIKEGNPDGSVTTEGALKTGHQFLVDIAHHAVPGAYDLNHDGVADGIQTADTDPGVGDDGDPTTYDDEMLNAHFVSGDGRGNENIALTAIHSVFHSEHNRVVEADKLTILESGDRDFINEWLLVDLAPGAIPTDPDTLMWNGDRLFQAGRFTTEMQYQHMVFEEFARRIQPAVDPFVFTNTADIDPSIIAEFAHAVYRFGHSMLNSSVNRLDNNLQIVGGDEQISLIDAFLNPQAYLASGADFEDAQAALIRGMSRDVGNEIDEFVVGALRSNLLGLPLDLPALNIARGRETGTPSLQEARAQLYENFGLSDLKPYTGWNDFVGAIKTPLSVINFIAAYGTHGAITRRRRGPRPHPTA